MAPPLKFAVISQGNGSSGSSRSSSSSGPKLFRGLSLQVEDASPWGAAGVLSRGMLAQLSL
jgi:hypothetical protein